MSFIKIDDSYLTQIADAIRRKSGNLGDTRIEQITTVTTEERPITKVLKTLNAQDFTTADPDASFWKDISYGYTDPNQPELNESATKWQVATIPGAQSVKVDIGYQISGSGYNPSGYPAGDWVAVMPGIEASFDAALGQRLVPNDQGLYRTTLTFNGVSSVSIRIYINTGGLPREGLLGYYAEITGYNSDGEIITEEVEITNVEEKEVPNTYTPEQMAPAILKLEPAPYIAYIELSGMQEAFFNEQFTTDGLIVTGYFSDESSSVLSGWTSSIENNTELDPGKYTVVISYTDENGISATASYEINVYELNLVSWSTGSEDDIKAMVAAADAGRINLYDYWEIGDERTINFKTDSITDEDNAILAELGFEDDFTYERTLVLVHHDPKDYSLVDSTIARSIPNFVVQFKENSIYSGKMNQTYMISKYSDTAISQLLDQVWYNNLPDWLQSIIKPVKVKCWLPPKPPRYDFEGSYYLDCKIFLPSRNEITNLGYGDDGVERWEYYIIDTDNVFKKAPTSDIYTPWLTRSCIMQFASGVGGTWPQFQVITGSEGQTQVLANQDIYRIAPAFCI